MIGFLRTPLIKRAAVPAPEPTVFDIDGRKVPLRFRRNAKARRLVLRLDIKNQGLVMTLPKRTGLSDALRFAESSRQWIVRTLSKQAPVAPVVDGAHMLYQGHLHCLHFSGGRRGVVTASDSILHIPGDAAHAPRRLRDYLKDQALKALSAASKKYALAMGTRYARISIRDQKSRWGSCSSGGVLSYSWRLILAPDFVLDYVAAHEVAHLIEMNHGPRFWRLVLTHCPHARHAKQWLKAHGKDVHRYF